MYGTIDSCNDFSLCIAYRYGDGAEAFFELLINAAPTFIMDIFQYGAKFFFRRDRFIGELFILE